MSKSHAQRCLKDALSEIDSKNFVDAAHLCVASIRAAKKAEKYSLAGKAFQLILSLDSKSQPVIAGLKKEAEYLMMEDFLSA